MSNLTTSDEENQKPPLNEVALTLLPLVFTQQFKKEWDKTAKQLNTPRRGLRRTANGVLLNDHTDTLILRRFKTEVPLVDYFSPNPPKQPQFQAKLNRTSTPIHKSPTVPRVNPPEPQKSKLLSRIESCIDDDAEQSFGKSFCGRSVSTYPHIPDEPKRLGDPICDHWATEIFSNRIILAVADGCGWGHSAQKAAITASNSAISFLRECEMDDLQVAAHFLLSSLAHADKKIKDGASNVWECGTTTMVVGQISQIEQKYVFVAASIGDCKVYHYKAKERIICDLTFDNREISPDPSDPGGRIGPFKEGGAPDLRNLDLYSAICEKGDLLISVSDGVHDNLDPELLGYSPRDLFLEFDTWKDIIPATVVPILKSKFAQQLLKILLIEDCERLTARHCVNVLINHAQNVTRNTRDWVYQNPQERLPTNYRMFPGKLDHTTCVVFEVGASYEGLSQVFQSTQDQLAVVYSDLRKNITRQQVHLERQYFSLNVPIQVTMGCTETHMKIYCRTLDSGACSVLVDEHRLYLKVSCCPSLQEILSPEELESFTLIEGDEFAYPIERTIELPFPADESPDATNVEYDELNGIIRISIKKKRKPESETPKAPTKILLSRKKQGRHFLAATQ